MHWTTCSGAKSDRVMGPLPPYSFSTVAVTELTRAQVGEARPALELNEGAPRVEVRRTCRRLAVAAQRDLESGDERAGERLGGVQKASETSLGISGRRGYRRRGARCAEGHVHAVCADGLAVVLSDSLVSDYEPTRAALPADVCPLCGWVSARAGTWQLVR